MIEIKPPDKLEAGIRELHGQLMWMLSIQATEDVGISARAMVCELEKILNGKEGEHEEEAGSLY